MAKQLYRLTNSDTGEEFIGTLQELSEKSGISVAILEDMAAYSYSHKRYFCEPYHNHERDFSVNKPSTNSELDRIAWEARKHGMSYGQYVGLTENNWRHRYV